VKPRQLVTRHLAQKLAALGHSDFGDSHDVFMHGDFGLPQGGGGDGVAIGMLLAHGCIGEPHGDVDIGELLAHGCLGEPHGEVDIGELLAH
jgi:hypothetical protein